MSMTFNRLSRPFFALITLVFFTGFSSGFAQEPEATQEAVHQEADSHKEKFDPAEMIMHHIQDAHEIHLGGDMAIYLPVIIYHDGKFDVFSSRNLYHNKTEVTTPVGRTEHYYKHGKYILLHEHIYLADADGGVTYKDNGEVANEAAFDLSITKSVIGVFLTGLILILIFGSVAKSYKKRKDRAPKGLQSFMEPLILFIRDEVAVPSIGEGKADRYMPFLLTIFFFIWVANILGLIPFIGGFNVTGTIAVTLVLAAIVFIITTFSGNKHYWGHILWPPGVPFPIKLILVPIEFLGIFIKPIVLMIRLTANITAGHIIILAFVALVLIFGEISDTAGYGVGVGSVLFMVFMYFIELLVAFLQAYVFTLLASLYFGDAKQEAHH